MKKLLELCSVITRQKIKQIAVLDPHHVRRDKNLLYKFYNGLVKKEVQTDEEAARFLYKIPVPDSRYRQLKNVLKERLINTVFFIDAKKGKFSSRTEAEIACYKYLAALHILKHFGAHETIVSLAKKVFKKADRFELTLPCLNALGVLCHYMVRTNKYKEFIYYQEKLEEKALHYQVETSIRNKYFSLAHMYVAKKSNLSEMTEKAKVFMEEVQEGLQKVNTVEAISYGYMIYIIALAGPEHLDERIRLCEEALKLIEEKPFKKKENTLIYIMNLALFYIAKKDYIKGEKVIKNGLKVAEPGSFNWFKMKELHFMLCMHTEHYLEANVILQEVLSVSAFRRMPPYIQELWQINQAYVFLLKETGILPEGEKHHSFKIGKFFNEVPVYSKDKRGVNIPILILQFIFWLNRGKFNRLFDRTESLRQYVYKYLKNPNLKRSNLFLKMLCATADASFHPIAVKRKTEKWHQELIRTPLDLSNQPFELEVMPYEKLWEIVLAIINEHK